mgnify:FL=1
MVFRLSGDYLIPIGAALVMHLLVNIRIGKFRSPLYLVFFCPLHGTILAYNHRNSLICIGRFHLLELLLHIIFFVTGGIMNGPDT